MSKSHPATTRQALRLTLVVSPVKPFPPPLATMQTQSFAGLRLARPVQAKVRSVELVLASMARPCAREAGLCPKD